MANSKPSRLPSAAKHMRADARKRAFNRARKTKVHDAEKELNAAIAAGNKEAVVGLLSKCYSQLDKAAKTGVIHKNKADRKKARLAARIAKMA
ncbi:MAG: 30S ribosomal protein S20 [Lentisphaeria bacterium]|nr:30S ribosomal protein S20 [Lentisphaeria bacterium]